MNCRMKPAQGAFQLCVRRPFDGLEPPSFQHVWGSARSPHADSCDNAGQKPYRLATASGDSPLKMCCMHQLFQVDAPAPAWRLDTQPQKLLQPPQGWGQHLTHLEILLRMKRLGLFFPLLELSTNYPKAHQQFSAVAEILALLVFEDLYFAQAVCLLQVRA